MDGARPGSRSRSFPSLVLRALVVAGFYVLGARLGLELAFENRNVTAVWPPTGIAVAGLLLWGYRIWPGIAAGAIAANLLNNAAPETAILIGVGNTAAPVLAAGLLRRIGFHDAFDRVKDVVLFFVVSGVAMIVSASAGTGVLWLTDALGEGQTISVWLLWWAGDTFGVILFAPLLILLMRMSRSSPLLQRPVEAAALCIGAAGIAYGVLYFDRPLAFIISVPIVWIALRFEQSGAALVVVIVSTIAIAQTIAGRGQFTLPMATPTENLVTLLVFAAAVAFASMVLAVVMHQRTRAERALRSSEDRYRSVFEQASDLVCMHNELGRLTFVNATTEQITGYSRERLLTMSLTDLVAPESVQRVRRTIERQLAGDTDTATYEVDVVGTSGRRLAMELRSTPILIDGAPTGVQIIGRDVTSRRLAEDQLRRQSLHDPLTGLANRILLREHLDYALGLARRDGTQVAMILIDIDDFREVNARLGHDEGSRVLIDLGERLRQSFREPDTVARLGGDEFAVLAPSLAPGRSLEVIAEQVRAEAGDDTTVSIGIALFPDHADDADTLMLRAEAALHDAKRAGGDRHSVFRATMDSQGMRRFTLEDELHSAVEDKAFELHFQPMIETAGMRTLSVEALLRWNHHTLGSVPPAEIIPLAIASNLMDTITDWVLDQAIGRCAIWNSAGFDIGVAVNLASSDLHNVTEDRIRAHLTAHDLPGELLTVEVSEQDVRNEAAHAVLERIAGLGVRISIDDFGTDTSSMAHLSSLPLAELKIDRSFVTDVVTNPRNHAVARSIVELAHNLGVRAVAEGVETREAWSALEELGCDAMQGYMICRPSS